MFFGAGNVVFPLTIGQFAKDQNLFAILGLLITAVGVPFLGLLSMTLYNGNYKKYFERIGRTPGFLVSFLIMSLIGPLGAIPRCIALSYSTAKIFLPELSLPFFSCISCLIIFLFTFKRNRILDLLGYLLTPLLLLSLGVIIVKGLSNAPTLTLNSTPAVEVFFKGVKEGYQTMDLLGAFFFSSVVVTGLTQHTDPTDPTNSKKIIKAAGLASFIGASLLGFVYIGFSFVAAYHSESIKNIQQDLLIGQIALNILGAHLGFIACIAVALACLTTAIALATVSAEFIHKDLTFNRVSYLVSLIITLVISYYISTLNFTGIVSMLAPILQILYPALLVLSILNIFYKIYHIKPVKVPFFATLILVLLIYLI